MSWSGSTESTVFEVRTYDYAFVAQEPAGSSCNYNDIVALRFQKKPHTAPAGLLSDSVEVIKFIIYYRILSKDTHNMD